MITVESLCVNKIFIEKLEVNQFSESTDLLHGY